MSLMIHKVEDMKAMLQEEDLLLYNEWRSLFETLHTPEFHVRERIIQNKRVKSTFERKRKYKDEAADLRSRLSATSLELTNLQKLSNETSQQLSKSINILQDERAGLVCKVEEKKCELDERNEKIAELKMELERKNATISSLEEESNQKDREIERVTEKLRSKEGEMKQLQNELSHTREDLAVSNEKASSALATLENIETKFATHRIENESALDELQQELIETKTRNTVISTQLATTKDLLDEATRELDCCRNEKELKMSIFIDDTRESLAELKTEAMTLKELLSSDISGKFSALDKEVSKIQTMVNEATEQHKQTKEETMQWIRKNQNSLDITTEMCTKLAEENDALKKVISNEKKFQESMAAHISKSQHSLDEVKCMVTTIIEAEKDPRLDEIKSLATDQMDALQAVLSHEICSQESLSSLKTGSSEIHLELSRSQERLDELVSKVSDLAGEAKRKDPRLDDLLVKISTLEQNGNTALNKTIANERYLSNMEKGSNQIQLEVSRSHERLNELVSKVSDLADEAKRKDPRLDDVIVKVSELAENGNNALNKTMSNERYLSNLEKASNQIQLEVSRSHERLDELVNKLADWTNAEKDSRVDELILMVPQLVNSGRKNVRSRDVDDANKGCNQSSIEEINPNFDRTMVGAFSGDLDAKAKGRNEVQNRGRLKRNIIIETKDVIGMSSTVSFASERPSSRGSASTVSGIIQNVMDEAISSVVPR